jgi:hypothetical protein
MEPIANARELLYIFLLIAGAAFVLAMLLLAWVLWQVGRINVPEDADFFTALWATPLSVVIMLDLLDASLDVLSAPVAWILLSKLGLKPLRAVTAIEGLIPGTNFIPTLTLCWIIARLPGSRRLFKTH